MLGVMTESFAGLTLNSVTSHTKFYGKYFTSRIRLQSDGDSSYHSRAIRSLQFHPTYPLFASSSDDGSIQVFHSRVYNDLMTDPLIVPLKILRGHDVVEGLGVLQVKWSSKHPWLVSSGADGLVSIWCS